MLPIPLGTVTRKVIWRPTLKTGKGLLGLALGGWFGCRLGGFALVREVLN